ncbi:MAG: hypothetical protein AAGG08_13750, partial [Actinomycetota bacterium]
MAVPRLIRRLGSGAVASALLAGAWMVHADGRLGELEQVAPTAGLQPAERRLPSDQSSIPVDAVSVPGDYRNDFSTAADGRRIHQFVVYRDPWVVNHTTGSSDHVPTGGIDCSPPEQTRPQTRENPVAHVYQCLPGGNAAMGHQMAYAMDTSGYGFVGASPDRVFEGVREVSVDVNTTASGSRNFVEIKIVPANRLFLDAMPCVPDLPCNEGWDYDDVGGVAAATHVHEGAGLVIATPSVPDGYLFDRFEWVERDGSDRVFQPCSPSSFCFHAVTHEGNPSVRQRFRHTFRDDGDGTLSFGIERVDGGSDWVEAPGAFPDGPVRVVIAFHNYTGTKDGHGPGFAGNESASTGGFTWHWDDLEVSAARSTSAVAHYGGVNAERAVTPDGCIAFGQGQRNV